MEGGRADVNICESSEEQRSGEWWKGYKSTYLAPCGRSSDSSYIYIILTHIEPFCVMVKDSVRREMTNGTSKT